MKHLLILIISVFFANFQTKAQDSMTAAPTITDATTSSLTVKVTGLNSDEGTLKIGVYNSEGTWLANSQYRQITDIENRTATVVFENIPEGTYGISTYHDENNNSELDKGLFGIPSEPYASSRGAKGRFGPPKWKDAKFDISTPTHTEEIKF